MLPAKHISPPDPVLLLQKAIAHCEEARARKPSKRSAIQFRNGVIILVHTSCALRLHNLAEIRIGKHLVIDGPRMRLVFDDSVKNGEIIDVPVCGQALTYLRQYLEHVRPILLDRRPDHGSLWVNVDGDALNYTGMGCLITTVSARIGHRTTAHQTRHALVTTLMSVDPTNIEIAAAALAHRGSNTANQVYDRSGSLSAQRCWLNVLQNPRRR